MKIFYKAVFVVVSFLFLSHAARASHAQGADLTYRFLGYNCVTGKMQYLVVASFYRDCSGISAPTTMPLEVTNTACLGGSYDTFYNLPLINGLPCPYGGVSNTDSGCQVSQLCPLDLSQSSCNPTGNGAYPGVEKYVYIDTVYLPGSSVAQYDCNQWYFSISVSDRNSSTNLQNANSNPLYVEALVNNSIYYDTAAIAAPYANTTAVTGFPEPGSYGFVWSSGTCSATDTTYVTVTSPSAGPNQSICYNDTATMAATGSGIWHQTSGPLPVVIADSASPTTIITGFIASGNYTFSWTSAPACQVSGTVTITVSGRPYAGPDQTICQYSTATMDGIGTGTWSALPSNPAITSITAPSSPTTTITGFSQPGVYTFVLTYAGCPAGQMMDSMTVTVTAKPDAGPDQTICRGTTATMAAIGTGTWTAISGNPATTVIDTPSSPTTAITGFTASGTYKYKWSSGGCTDTADVIVSPKSDAGPDQTICPATGAKMAAIGTGTWTALASNPAPTVITTPGSDTTSITGFTLSGTYGYVWTSAGCTATDTANVLVAVKANAGPDQTLCEYGTATMAAQGAGIWSAPLSNPAVATINSPSSPATTIDGFTAPGTYNFIWTAAGCTNTDTATVTVKAKPNAGADQTICQYNNITLSAIATVATVGAWSVLVSNPAGSIIANPSSFHTAVSGGTGGFQVTGTYGYIWTVSGCTDTTYATVISKPNAGPDQGIFPNTTATMGATGTGTWSALPSNPTVATITNPASDSTTITGMTVCNTYGFVWSSGGCTDTVYISTKPGAANNQNIVMGQSATLTSTGSGTWTALSSNPKVLQHTYNNSITFGYDPVPFVCANYPVSYNNGASDIDNDSVVYSLINPLGAHNSPIPFTPGYTVNNPIMTNNQFNFNPVTGQINFTPDQIEIDVLALRVSQYQNGVLVGSTIRDVQVKILSCVVPLSTQYPPSSLVNANLQDSITVQLCPNTTASWNIKMRDSNGDSIIVKSNLTASPSPLPGATVTQIDSSASVVSAHITWTPQLSDTGCHYYNITSNTIDCPIEGNTTLTYRACVYNVVTVSPHEAIYCGTPVQLSATGGTDASWSPPAGIIYPNTDSLQPLAAPSMTTKYTFNSACGSDTSLIIYNTPFRMSAGPGGTICQNNFLQLDGSLDSLYAPYTIEWLPSAGLSNPITNAPDDTILDPIASPLVTTTYTLKVTANTGCIRTDTTTVTVHGQAPNITAHGTPDSICPGQQVTLWVTNNPSCGPATAACVGSADIIQVGTAATVQGGTAFTYPAPYGNYYKSARHQFLFRASELASLLGSGGTIESVAMDVGVLNSGSTLDNFTIRIGCVPDDSLTGYVDQAYLTTVYVANYTPVAGWNVHTLQTPYNWDGQSNLAVDMCFDNNSDLNINPKMVYTTTSFPSIWYTYTNAPAGSCGYTGTPPTSATAATYYQRPNFRFNMCVPQLTNLAWTPATGPDAVTLPTRDTTFSNPSGQTTYYVTLNDTNGCSSRSFMTIYVDTSLELTAGPDTFICSSSPINLHAVATAAGGSGINLNTIKYVWSTRPSAAVAPDSGIGPGFANPTVTPTATTTYICSISGAGLCTITDSATVTLGIGLPVHKTVDSITCSGANNGAIYINMNAGTPPYQYVWTPPATGNTDSITGLSPGTYTLSVTDHAGCIGRDTTTLIAPVPITLSFDSTNLACYDGNTGAITALISGGRAPFRYTWAPAANNTGTLTGLPAGTYDLTVTDTSGCTASDSVHITQPPRLVSTVVTTPLSGNNTNDGTITITTTGGTPGANPPYTYTCDSAIAGLPDATNLDTGIYIITIKDSNGCTVNDTAHISGPPPIVITFATVNNLCSGYCSGTATASASGGVPPYTYVWNTVPTTVPLGNGTTITNLCAGTYQIIVTDSNHIHVAKDTIITAPAPVSMKIDSTPITCFNAANGSLYDSIWGGTGPYTVTWTPGSSTSNPINNLGPGMYIVNVTDLNNCPGADTAYLGQPAPLTLDTLSTDSAVCFGQSNGYANLLATGGRPPYTYAWSGSTSVDSFAGDLAAGSQTVTVTDQGNCHASFAFAIYQPTQILITAVNVTAAHCATSHDGVAVALISGGSPAYTYTWDATSTGGIDSITGLVPGSHTLTVTDSKGCTQTGPFTIDTQYVLHIAMGSDSVTCSGGANGVAFTTALNGYPAYTYSWNPANSSGDSATGLSISTQNVTVTDIYGCTASGSVSVAQPDAVTDVASFSNPTCTGFLNGKVWVSAGGTEGPYTFTFNGATRPITDTVFGLGAGTYHFTVYDAKGCPKQDSVVLSDPLKLAVPPPVIVNITCYNSNNGSIQLSPTGGTPPYTYTWSPGGYTAAQQDSLSPATYVITVTDANGCSVTRSIQMPAPSRITLLSAKSDSVSCPDSSDGHIVVDPTGGTPGDFIPYTYSINGSIYYTNHNFYNLAAGAYNISVMDSQGCTFDTVLNVYQPAPVTASVNPQDSMVALGSGIQLFTTINNATTQSINSYTWTPSVGLSCLDCPNPVASPYQATQYYLTVNYGKNCTTTASDKVLVGPGASIYIPNAFTPNGDGVNDYFEAFGTTLQSVSMKIFDRWGEKVFDSGDDQWASWDGRYRGVMQPPAVYVYLIQLVFLDGSQQTRQGSLTLIR